MHGFFQHFYVYPKKIIHLLHLFNGLWLVVHCICPYLYLYLYLLSYIFFKKQSVKVWLEKIKKKKVKKQYFYQKFGKLCQVQQNYATIYIFYYPVNTENNQNFTFYHLHLGCRCCCWFSIFSFANISKQVNASKSLKMSWKLKSYSNKLAFLKMLLDRIDVPIF